MEIEVKFYGKLNGKEYTDVNSFMVDLFNCNENELGCCDPMQELLENITNFNCNIHSQCKDLFYNEKDNIEPIEEDDDIEELLDDEKEDEVTNVPTLPKCYSNDIEYLVPEIDKFIIKYSDDKMFNDAASEYKNSLDKRISYLHEIVKNSSIEELDVLEKALTKADIDTVQAIMDSEYAKIIFQLTHDYNKAALDIINDYRPLKENTDNCSNIKIATLVKRCKEYLNSEELDMLCKDLQKQI